MFDALTVILVAALPLSCGELLLRLTGLQEENGRKLVHVLGGVATLTFAALAPLNTIGWVMVGYIFLMVVVRRTLRRHIRSFYGVPRPSHGEIWFPAGVGAAAFAAGTKDAYLAAMVFLGFADALAAIIGSKWPAWKIHILDGVKSFGGSLAFFATGFAGCLALGYSLPASLLAAFASGGIELLSPRGLDNLTVPLTAVLVLNGL